MYTNPKKERRSGTETIVENILIPLVLCNDGMRTQFQSGTLNFE